MFHQTKKSNQAGIRSQVLQVTCTLRHLLGPLSSTVEGALPAGVGRGLVRPVFRAVAEVVVDPFERDQGPGFEATEQVLAVRDILR